MLAFNLPALSALVSAQWLHQRVIGNAVTVIDASWYLPGSAPATKGLEEYKKRHIPGALYFDIDALKLRDSSSDLPHMLPPPSQIASIERAFGLRSGRPVVVYENDSAGPLCASARVWWMARSFGVRDVFVLDGGLTSWLSNGYPIESGENSINTEADDKVQAYERNDLIWSMNDVQQLVDKKDKQKSFIMDARSEGRFLGTDPEPRKGLKSGHMPGAVSVPSSMLVDAGNKKLHPPEELARILHERSGASPEELQKRGVVCSCGSGVTAAIVALALHEVGVEGAGVYDGSWVEWASKKPDIIEQGRPQ